MNAMILAAGLGSRLKPLTDETPKALVPICGRPMIEHVILRLKAAGFNRIVINVHHYGQQIIDFLSANKNFGAHIQISDEQDYLLDTGGAIKKAARFLQGKDPFLVHNVDIVSDIDLGAFYRQHADSPALATLLVSHRDTSRYLLFNDENRLCGWRNRDTGEVKSYYPDFDPSRYQALAFSGIHVISPRVFEWMEEWTGKFSIIHFYLSVCAKADLRAYQASDLTLFDVGKPDFLKQAEEWMNCR